MGQLCTVIFSLWAFDDNVETHCYVRINTKGGAHATICVGDGTTAGQN